VRNKKKTMNIKNTIILTVTLFAILTSCDVENALDKDSERKTSAWIDIPFVSVDTLYLSGQKFNLLLTDSTPYYNPVVVEQYIAIHSLQSEPMLNGSGFDFLNVEIRMPSRSDGGLKFEMTDEQFMSIFKGYSNQIFRNFIRDLLVLNNKTSHKYRDNWTTLLDRLNMLFGEEINEKYGELFPENSTWNGYNSFRIFGIFLEECLSSRQGVGHNLIHSINGKTKYVFQEDIESVNALIIEYENQIKNNTAHNKGYNP
jgi:hypothetical protein